MNRQGSPQGLVLDGASATHLAERYGTPLFVMLENTVRSNFRRFEAAFKSRYPAEVIVCVGMKAQYGLAERRVIVEEGGGADVFGQGELQAAVRMGTDPGKLVMNGPNKAEDAIRLAVEAGILINVDNGQELERVAGIASSLDREARVALRVRLPFDELDQTFYTDSRFKDPGIDLGHWLKCHKFGMDPSGCLDVLREALRLPDVCVEGFHTHGGLPRRAGYAEVESREFMIFVQEAYEQLEYFPRFLNVGGGFSAPRRGCGPVTSIEEYADQICGPILEQSRELGFDPPTLICEPGRYCFESAGVWLTRVGQTKSDSMQAKKRWAYVDGNINEMADPFDPFAGWHEVAIANDLDRTEPRFEVDICGQLCNGEDILARERLLPLIQPGDLLAFLDMGAYNEAFANNANAVPRSATVMVRDGQIDLIRRRQTIEELFARDRLPAWLQRTVDGHLR